MRRWAANYDTCPNKTRDLDAIAFRSQVKLISFTFLKQIILRINCVVQDFDFCGKTVAEYGCGTGRHTEWVVEKFGRAVDKYTAMDISEVMKK